MNQEKIDKLLRDNGQLRKLIIEGPNTLMRAISDTLFFTTHMHAEISDKLVQFIKNLIDSNDVPPCLAILETNHALFEDYCSHPNFIGFDKINIELVSLMYRVKVNIYQVSEDEQLTVKIVNKNHSKTIELFKNQNHYDSVYSRTYLEDALDVQQLIYEMLFKAIKYAGKVPQHFRNIELELESQDGIQQSVEQKDSKKVRSLSDQFNNDNNKVDTLENTLEEKFNKMFEISQTATPNSSSVKVCPPCLNMDNQISSPKKVIEKDTNSTERFFGRLKFFDEKKNYGFIVLDKDNSDMFIHADDLQKVGITREILKATSGNHYKSQTGVRHFGTGPGQAPRFSFMVMVYNGKYNKSRKAVDLKLLIEN